MKKYDLKKFVKGWFIGGGFEPVIINSYGFEVAVKRYKAGDFEGKHVHKISTEITVIVDGEVEMNGQKYVKDDILVIEPGEATDFKALTDAITAVVKLPSVKGDKYNV